MLIKGRVLGVGVDVVHVIVVCMVDVDPTNLPLKFGKFGSGTAEMLGTLSVWWWWVVVGGGL